MINRYITQNAFAIVSETPSAFQNPPSERNHKGLKMGAGKGSLTSYSKAYAYIRVRLVLHTTRVWFLHRQHTKCRVKKFCVRSTGGTLSKLRSIPDGMPSEMAAISQARDSRGWGKGGCLIGGQYFCCLEPALCVFSNLGASNSRLHDYSSPKNSFRSWPPLLFMGVFSIRPTHTHTYRLLD